MIVLTSLKDNETFTFDTSGTLFERLPAELLERTLDQFFLAPCYFCHKMFFNSWAKPMTREVITCFCGHYDCPQQINVSKIYNSCGECSKTYLAYVKIDGTELEEE